MTMQIVIMAHPRRRAWALDLAEKLDAQVVFDRKNNVWDTCRRSWLAEARQNPAEDDYVLVLQDDAIVADNFRARAEAFISKHEADGDFIFSFYAGSQLGNRIEAARRSGRDYVQAGFIFNEIALCMKNKHILSMVHYCDERDAQNDQQITRWAAAKHLKVRYSIPSIVNHRAGVSIFRENEGRPNVAEERKAYFYAD